MTVSTSTRAERCGVLNNMSFQPRMTLRIRPLRHEENQPTHAPRISLIGSIDFEALEPRVPLETGSDCLRKLLRIAEIATGGGKTQEDGPSSLLEEELVDRLIDAASRIDPAVCGLPPFAIVRTRAGGGPSTAPLTDPARVVSLLTRLSGHLFIARRTPHPRSHRNRGQTARALGVLRAGRRGKRGIRGLGQRSSGHGTSRRAWRRRRLEGNRHHRPPAGKPRRRRRRGR